MVNSPVQEIKEKLDIVDFIRSYITLTPAGKNFKALCPFHKEKTPSFMVSPDRQTWHCFGACAEGGDIFKFLMKYENLEFYEALKILAEKAGIELKRISPAEQKQFGILYDINSLAKDFYKKQLEKSPKVLEYLKSRGLKDETIQEFELGLAPDSFEAVSMDMISLGHDVRDVERAGLIFKNERGRYTDRFRNRIMFPIYNSFGKVIGFSGRILTEADLHRPDADSHGKDEAVMVAKYINSPETPIFNKSRTLYGFHKTKEHIKEQNAAVLVEGQMDFLALYEDGVKNVVATSGTALTPDHLKTLRRFTDQLIFSFDNDEAGFKAAERSIDLAQANDFNVKLLTLGEYKDPAEAVQKQPGLIKGLIEKTIHAMEFYFSRYLGSADKRGDMSGLKKNLRVVLSKIKNLASPVERDHWLKELGTRTKISEKALAEEMEQLKVVNWVNSSELVSSKTNQLINQLTSQPISRRELIAERLLSLIMAREELKQKIEEYIKYLPHDYLLLLKNLSDGLKLEEERLTALLNLISLRSSFELEILGEEKLNEEFQNLLNQIRLEYLKEKRQGLAELIKEHEKNGDEEKTAELLKEFKELSQSISE